MRRTRTYGSAVNDRVQCSETKYYYILISGEHVAKRTRRRIVPIDREFFAKNAVPTAEHALKGKLVDENESEQCPTVFGTLERNSIGSAAEKRTHRRGHGNLLRGELRT